MCLNSASLYLALQEKYNEYSEKQKAGGSPTKSMLKLAWDLQELSALNHAGREVRVACEADIFCAACFTISTNTCLLLVVMISAEDRKKKPYAIPVQCIAYKGLKDAEVRNIANNVIREMHKRNEGCWYVIIHIHIMS